MRRSEHSRNMHQPPGLRGTGHVAELAVLDAAFVIQVGGELQRAVSARIDVSADATEADPALDPDPGSLDRVRMDDPRVGHPDAIPAQRHRDAPEPVDRDVLQQDVVAEDREDEARRIVGVRRRPRPLAVTVESDDRPADPSSVVDEEACGASGRYEPDHAAIERLFALDDATRHTKNMRVGYQLYGCIHPTFCKTISFTETN